MFGAMFRNMPPVVKNLVIINALFLLAAIVLPEQGVDIYGYLGLHYPSSPLFKPYQLATHFFMHGGFLHFFLNMFALVVFGSQLERMWGPKRFLIFYFITALGAAFLHILVQGIELYQICGEYFPDYETAMMKKSDMDTFRQIMLGPTVGASGAVYGLIAAFAMLFPNTQLMLLFPPIPIKAKWLALILAGIAVYSGWQNADGDSIAHFAHLGGMLFGFIIVKIWQRNNNNFY